MKLIENFKEVLNYGIGSFTLERLIQALLIFLVCIVVIKLVTRIIIKALDKMELDASLSHFIKGGIKVVLYFIAVLIVADSLGISVTSLVALFSVAGVAISLSVQGTLSNLANGILLLITKPFEEGDYIEAGGDQGTVKFIGLTYTKITTIDNKLILMPNSQVASAKIVNYSAEATRMVELNFEAPYETTMEEVKNAVMVAIDKNEKILKTPKPFIRISSYGESAIKYLVRVWVDTPDYWTVHFDLLEDVKNSFDENNIEMTYNHLNVHLIK